MKIHRILTLIAAGAALGLCFLLPAFAEQAGRSPQPKMAPAAAAQGNGWDQRQLEAFRGELGNYISEMRTLGQMLAEDTFGNISLNTAQLESLNQLTDFQRSLPDLSYNDLYMLREALNRNPNWSENPELLRSVFTPEVRQHIQAVSRASQPQAVKDKNGRTVYLQVAPCSVPSSGSLTQTAVYIAKGVALGLEIVRELVPDDSATAAPHIAASIVWGAAETAALIVEGILAVDTECDDQNFQKRVDDFMLDVQPRIVDIQTRVIDIQKQQTEARRRTLEENVDYCRPLISIYLPAPFGRLEEVRDFVQAMISNSANAGINGQPAGPPPVDPYVTYAGPPPPPALTGLYLTAQNYQTQGVASMTSPNKRYKEAFNFFCKAYASIVRAGDNP